MSNLSDPQTLGIHHLGLTVPSVEEAVSFFTSALGFKVVGGNAEYPATFVTDGSVMLTLWQAKTMSPTGFDRRQNIGLHHFALRVANVEALSSVYDRLKNYPGVEIEFAPENLSGLPAKHMMCLIPGGIRMEIIASK